MPSLRAKNNRQYRCPQPKGQTIMASRSCQQVENTEARHAEIARRYAWQARRKLNGEKPDKARLITLIRMRELERIFQHRYGRLLPDDDAGRDDLILMAHHIAFLGGDIIAHILAWGRAWAPWLPQDQAEQLAERVRSQPHMFTADILGWRLRLSMAERGMLKITTIGAFDLCKAERAEARKQKDREAKRAKRAKNSTGRPRGRPRKTVPKNASAAVREANAVDGISERPVRARTNIAATKPSADAVGTTAKSIGLKVDAGAAGVGNPERRFKTRFPTSMRLSNEQRAYARDAGFEPRRIDLMFELFRLFNRAQGNYSANWERVWFNWVDRQVDFEAGRHQRERRRVYFERRRQPSKEL